jgi:hypothetical protein
MTAKAAAGVETLVPDHLTVCTYGGFAPVCYNSPGGQLIGLDVSFLTRFAESLGLAIVAIEKPFDRIWTLPGENVCDIAGAGIMRRDDRPPGLGGSWSSDYFQVERSLVVRASDKAAFDNYKTLSGRKIVVTRGRRRISTRESGIPTARSSSSMRSLKARRTLRTTLSGLSSRAINPTPSARAMSATSTSATNTIATWRAAWRWRTFTRLTR